MSRKPRLRQNLVLNFWWAAEKKIIVQKTWVHLHVHVHVVVLHFCKYSFCVHAILIKFDMCRNNFRNFRCISHPCLFRQANDHENSGRRRAVQKAEVGFSWLVICVALSKDKILSYRDKKTLWEIFESKSGKWFVHSVFLPYHKWSYHRLRMDVLLFMICITRWGDTHDKSTRRPSKDARSHWVQILFGIFDRTPINEDMISS